MSEQVPKFSDSIDYIVRLHNYLSRIKQVDKFEWVCSVSGAANNHIHTAQAKLNGEVIAIGTGSARNVAKRLAAYDALSKLEPGQLV
ncbi:unnamed protein product [Peniophora sp. CBMAI 1063]|nr:unnamed protein product [Peniophora sp. CBMAI 1063]